MNSSQATPQPQQQSLTQQFQEGLDRCRHNAAEAQRVTAQETARKASGQLTQQELFNQNGITGPVGIPGQFSPC